MARLALALTLALWLSGPAYAAPPTADPATADSVPADLLRRIDVYRLASKNVMAIVGLIEVDRATATPGASHDYKVFLNPEDDSVIEMLSANEQGRRVLMTESAVWLRLPTSDRPIHITPLQRLLGQANYGDVGRLSWDGAYRIREMSDSPGLERPPLDRALEPSGDHFRPLAGHPIRHLVLEATSPAATYPRIELWASRQDDAPLRADYFLTSGKRLKTGWFSEPVSATRGKTARSVVFEDELSPQKVTVMTTRSVQDRELPKSFFTVRGFTTAVGE